MNIVTHFSRTSGLSELQLVEDGGLTRRLTRSRGWSEAHPRGSEIGEPQDGPSEREAWTEICGGVILTQTHLCFPHLELVPLLGRV